MTLKTVPLSQLTALIGCTNAASVDHTMVDGIATLATASNKQVSFLANKRYKKELSTTKAVAVLVDAATHAAWENKSFSCSALLIPCRDPYLAFAMVQRFFHPEPVSSGLRHASAIIHPDAVLADDVDVDALAVIGQGTYIARACIIGAGVIIGDHCSLGEGCLLHARSVVGDGCTLGKRVILQSGAVIGSDGFGYAWDGKSHIKIPQTGSVVLHDDVEIGANTCIDRGALANTIVYHQVKIDNLVQLGHSVEIGASTVIVSQAGVAGSSHIGKGCQLGGQVGIAGHLRIADGCKIAGQSGVINNLDATGVYGGSPAMPHRMWLKGVALVNRLPELFKKAG
ncbi:MAG: UDP-3-O-(3-hydroxymyristoyl)glucosamine N-acyltransferase [Mariprofundaceae bacterium]|nr:UDP-3-O-(3-hydroxymyristoyl)glucosamine N-acyltransferase [Mariprofundaceae bacterium]